MARVTCVKIHNGLAEYYSWDDFLRVHVLTGAVLFWKAFNCMWYVQLNRIFIYYLSKSSDEHARRRSPNKPNYINIVQLIVDLSLLRLLSLHLCTWRTISLNLFISQLPMMLGFQSTHFSFLCGRPFVATYKWSRKRNQLPQTIMCDGNNATSTVFIMCDGLWCWHIIVSCVDIPDGEESLKSTSLTVAIYKIVQKSNPREMQAITEDDTNIIQDFCWRL